MDMIMGFLPSIVFGVIVWFITQVIKTILHKIFPQMKGKRPWKKLVLQSLPVVIGGLIALLVPAYPFPAHFMGGKVEHTMFGMFIGYMSGHIYSAIKLQAEVFVANLAEKLKKFKPTPKDSSHKD